MIRGIREAFRQGFLIRPKTISVLANRLLRHESCRHILALAASNCASVDLFAIFLRGSIVTHTEDLDEVLISIERQRPRLRVPAKPSPPGIGEFLIESSEPLEQDFALTLNLLDGLQRSQRSIAIDGRWSRADLGLPRWGLNDRLRRLCSRAPPRRRFARRTPSRLRGRHHRGSNRSWRTGGNLTHHGTTLCGQLPSEVDRDQTLRAAQGSKGEALPSILGARVLHDLNGA